MAKYQLGALSQASVLKFQRLAELANARWSVELLRLRLRDLKASPFRNADVKGQILQVTQSLADERLVLKVRRRNYLEALRAFQSGR